MRKGDLKVGGHYALANYLDRNGQPDKYATIRKVEVIGVDVPVTDFAGKKVSLMSAGYRTTNIEKGIHVRALDDPNPDEDNWYKETYRGTPKGGDILMGTARTLIPWVDWAETMREREELASKLAGEALTTREDAAIKAVSLNQIGMIEDEDYKVLVYGNWGGGDAKHEIIITPVGINKMIDLATLGLDMEVE